VRAFERFEQAREQAGLRFFADLQSEPVALIRANPQALAMITNKLDVVVVGDPDTKCESLLSDGTGCG
jgi:DNA helicase-2/ATP-dependent DNA helicase PcrA